METETKMIRIWADFNARDEEGRIPLNTLGSLEDIERHRHVLSAGLEVILYQDDIEVTAVLEFERIWRAMPDMESMRYIDSGDPGEEGTGSIRG